MRSRLLLKWQKKLWADHIGKKAGSIFLLFLLAKGHLWSTDYFSTQSAYFADEGRVKIIVDFNQYEKRGKFGARQYLLQEIPFTIRVAILRNLEASLKLPVVFGYNFLTEDRLPAVFGNVEIELRFGRDDDEYNYREAFYISYRIGSGPSVEKPAEGTLIGGDALDPSYYPAVSSLYEFSLGWHCTKDIGEKSQFHFNSAYTYQLNEGENLDRLINFEGVTGGAIETNANGENIQRNSFTLFGLDKSLKRLFWTTSLNNPWADKKNDYITLNAAIDTRLSTGFFFGKRQLILALKPFLEMTWLIPFSDESYYVSRFTLVPGMLLELTRYFRYAFGLAFFIDPLNDPRQFTQAVFMSLRLIF